jgi:integrase
MPPDPPAQDRAGRDAVPDRGRGPPHPSLASGDPGGRLGGLRIHDLRHTAVALWIAAGAGPKEVATRAGHMSVSFTLDRYGHLYPEADRALRDRLDRFDEAADDAE